MSLGSRRGCAGSRRAGMAGKGESAGPGLPPRLPPSLIHSSRNKELFLLKASGAGPGRSSPGSPGTLLAGLGRRVGETQEAATALAAATPLISRSKGVAFQGMA